MPMERVALGFLALRENDFAATVVKLQEEREQKVVDTGVYGVVRHPRTLFEERFLKRKLKGYEDYIKRVRYRLIPFLW